MAAPVTADQLALMCDVLFVRYAQLLGPAPEILTDLVRAGLVVWCWSEGVPIYELTAQGRATVQAAVDNERTGAAESEMAARRSRK